MNMALALLRKTLSSDVDAHLFSHASCTSGTHTIHVHLQNSITTMFETDVYICYDN